MKRNLIIILKIILDLFLFSLSIYLSFYLRFDGKIPSYYLRMFFISLPFELIIISILFNFFKIFRTIWVYTSINEMLNLIYAVVIEKSIFAFLSYILRDNKFIQNLFLKSSGSIYYPRSVLLISIALSILFSGGIRILFRIIYEKKRKELKILKEDKINLLIIGAGKTGISILRELKRNIGFNYNIVGFLDDDPLKIGMYVDNIKILGKTDDLKKIIEKYKIKEILIAIPSINTETIRKIVNLSTGKVKFKIVPSLNESINGKLSISRIRPLKLEDFLGREEVIIDLEKIKEFIKDKKILITGAAGSIGSELARQINKFDNTNLILLDINESELYMLNQEFKNKNHKIVICDIRNKGRLEYWLDYFKPDIIFHSAAYKHVPLMEEFIDEAIETNIIGTLNIVELADKYKVDKFIFISTDKAVNPKSIMGATKRIGELIVNYYSEFSNTKYMIVRFGNVLGSSGSVIPIFIKQIEKGGPITITDTKMERYFMTISEAVKLILQASSIGNGGEIFVLDMGKPIKIIDIAKALIRIYGYEPEKDIKIDIIGKRPGEKINEELFYNFEDLINTNHPKIYLIKNKKKENDLNLEDLKKDPKFLVYKLLNKN